MTEVAMKHPYIKSDPEVMGGVPCFKDTRVPVQHLFDYITGQSSLNDFLIDFPSVPRDIAIAILEEAKQSLLADATSS
jgi:uncharacterized protein (DUF433 family)